MKKILFLVSSFLTFLVAHSQEKLSLSYYLPQHVSYNSEIPTPESFFSWQVGEWHVSHDQLVSYLREVDRISDRMTLEIYARSYEGRPSILLTVTGSSNRTNLDKIKSDHLKLSDASQSSSLDVSRMPVVVWIGASVHGNEPSGSNAMLLLTYYLAAAQGPSIDSLLNETVILVDPAFNPDGLQRFSHWANTNKSKTLMTDPSSREFNETWPGGRFNHYWFDLNRDWLYVQHPESKGRATKFQEWKPNILTDHHEMGANSTFFFQPGVQSRVHPLTPKINQELTQKIGTFHAKALDKLGSLYFTEENYDDFYYGKGSTYPDVQGCIGILFEQASSRGHAQETVNGVLSFPFTIRNQFTTMQSTLAAARSLRIDLLNFQRDFYRGVANESKAASGYIFGNQYDKARNYEMLRILLQQKVEVYPLKNNISAEGKTFTSETSYFIPANQPQYRLVKAMFEKRTTFEDSLFYDISAFSLPLAFNMPYAEAKTASVGEKLTTISFPEGKVVGDKNIYGYVFAWDNYYAPRTVNELLKKGYQIRVATKPFTSVIEGKTQTFDYGTILIPVGLQSQSQEAILADMQAFAKRDGLDITGISTGLTPTGIDFGSSNFAAVTDPKAMLLVGIGVTATDAGEVWHLLDQRYNMPPAIVDLSYSNRVDFEKYNTIILSGGNYNGLTGNALSNLKRWVQNGGTLVAMSEAIPWAVSNGLANVKLKKIPSDSTGNKPYVFLDEYSRAQEIVGSIFQIRLDRSHPLAFGYKEETIPVFKDNTVFMEKAKNPYATPGQYTANPLLSGYISKQNLKQFSNAGSILVNSSGNGKVILFDDNPNFRAFWFGTNKLFMNALFFGRIINNTATVRTEE
ncbi:M14 family metallopeptidase [Xanthocytophaga flava]|uniref:M14 family metallopeptidase n=1 Tax=Xanthocytophaga flava TaxID=3048013 RepID=UPI0028D3FC7B|nr:M14 family metallopeptidase [Xanthocytophaga flavus]MDJ1470111.1 M14 family metallopeptidase [Xanthocytophaga flavus]